MHVCWSAIYECSEHSHRDPVANVVIYSAIGFFMSVVSLAFGGAAYALYDVPCGLHWLEPDVVNDVASGAAYTGLDSCHLVIPLAIAGFSIFACSLGITSGELHRPLFYSIFGGIGFVGIFAELYAFISTISMTVDHKEYLSDLVIGKLLSHLPELLKLLELIELIEYSWSKSQLSKNVAFVKN